MVLRTVVSNAPLRTTMQRSKNSNSSNKSNDLKKGNRSSTGSHSSNNNNSSSGNNNNNANDSHIRPTEAQLRWAQFHHKSRAREVKEQLNRLWKTPEAVKGVDGAASDDGASTCSEASDSSAIARIRSRRPKISRGRRAVLKVSQRAYSSRRAVISEQGFQCVGDKENDTARDEHDEASPNKARRTSRGKPKDEDRINRFEAAYAVMVNNVKPTSKPAIVRSTKRWTRPKNETTAGGTTNFQDWKWGIARRKRTANNKMNRALPFDRRASWLVHMPARESNVKRRYQYAQPLSSQGEFLKPVTLYEGAPATFLSPGQLKFDEMVSRLQEYDETPLPDQDIVTVSARYLNQLPKSEPIESPRVVRRQLRRDYDVEEEDEEPLRVVRRPKNSIGSRYEEEHFQHDTEDGEPLRIVRRSRDGNDIGARYEREYLQQDEGEDDESFRIRQQDHYNAAIEAIHGEEYMEEGEEDEQSMRMMRRARASTGIGARYEEEYMQQHGNEDEESLRVIRRARGSGIGAQYEQDYLQERGDEDEGSLRIMRRARGSGIGAQYEQDHLPEGEEDEPSLRVMRRARGSGIGAQYEQEHLHHQDEEEYYEEEYYEQEGEEEEESLRTVRRTRGTGIGARYEQEYFEQQAKVDQESLRVVRRARGSTGIGARYEQDNLQPQGDDDEESRRVERRARGSIGNNYEQYLAQQHQRGRVSEAHSMGAQSMGSVESDFFDKARRMHDTTPMDSSRRFSRKISLGAIPESSDKQPQYSPMRNSAARARNTSSRSNHGDSFVPEDYEASGFEDDSPRVSRVGHAQEDYDNNEYHGDGIDAHNDYDGGGFYEDDSPRVSHASFAHDEYRTRGFNEDDSPRVSYAGHSYPEDFNEDTADTASLRSHSTASRPGLQIANDSYGHSTTSSPRTPRSRHHSISSPPKTPRTRSREGGALLDVVSPTSECGEESVGQDSAVSNTSSFRMGAAKAAGGFFQRVTGISLTSGTSDAGSEIRAVAAFRKTQKERAGLNNDAASASTSSFRILPDGIRRMVLGGGASLQNDARESEDELSGDHCYPGEEQPPGLEHFNQASYSTNPTSPSRSYASRSLAGASSSMSPEHGMSLQQKIMEDSAFIGDDADQTIIDTDGTTSDASGAKMDAAMAASLLLSPTILTKRHQQAIKSIERRSWEQVGYLLSANPWLAEMMEVTTDQYLLHKLALYGASKFLLSDQNDAVDVVNAAPQELNEDIVSRFPSSVHKFDQDGNLPLHMAAASGNVDMAILLGERFPSGASVRNNDGMLPLHLAVQACAAPLANAHGDLVYGADFVALILQLFPGAVAVSDSEGDLPLHIAAAALEGEIGVDIIYLLLDEADRQAQRDGGLRFIENVRLKDEDSLDDATIETEAPTNSSDMEDDTMRCNMVRNEMGRTALTQAIEAGSGWQVIEAIARGPGGVRAAIMLDSNKCNALHLLLSEEFGDPQAALSILKIAPESATARNAARMLPIEIACRTEMPEEVILAMVLVDTPVDLSKKDNVKAKQGFGGSWYFLACESDDEYVDLVEEVISICSYAHLRELCYMKGGQDESGAPVLDRATPMCREVLQEALQMGETTAQAADRLYNI